MERPKREYAVAVLVVHGPCVLLLYHNQLKMWLPPGGHVEPDELPQEAAVREVLEETGLRVELVGTPSPTHDGVFGLVPPMGMQLEDIIPGGHQHIDLVFQARVVPGTDVVPRGNAESRRLGWYAPSEFSELGVNQEVYGWISRAMANVGASPRPNAIFDQGFALVGDRVRLRPFQPADMPELVRLWTDAQVMTPVGFPHGLPFDLEKAERWLVDRYVNVDFKRRGLHLAVTDRTDRFMGEVFVAPAEGIVAGSGGAPFSQPDVKLLPEFWGQGYGREVWGLLLDYIFANVPADIVQVTPNVENARALALYRRLGFTDVGEPAICPADDPATGQRGPEVPVRFQMMRLSTRDWVGHRS